MNMKDRKILIIIAMIFISLALLFSINLAQTQTQKQQQDNSGTVNGSNNQINGGVPKNVLIELFINANCTHCPKAAFCLEELAWSYEPGRVILVEAHIWGDGYDSPETNDRYDWYAGGGVKGTPDALFNGLSDRVQGLCCDCGDIEDIISAYQDIIDNQLEKTSPIQINVKEAICGGKIIVQGDIANKSHSMLHNLILGGMVYYEGDESELFYLVKDIFEDQDICQLAPMEEKKFSFVSDLDLSDVGESELDRYYCVVFVQDALTKEVLQSYLVQ